MRNALFCYFVRFCFNDNKNTKLKKYKKSIEKIKKNIKKHVF